MELYEFDVEVDVKPSQLDASAAGYRWQGDGEFAGIDIEVHPAVGHGFGLTDLITITVSVGVSATANLITEAIKAAVHGTVRRASVRKNSTDGAGQEVEQSTFDLSAKPLDEAVDEAVAGESDLT